MNYPSYGAANTQNQHQTSKARCEENRRKNRSVLNLEHRNNSSVERRKSNLINKPTSTTMIVEDLKHNTRTRKCSDKTAAFLNADKSGNTFK